MKVRRDAPARREVKTFVIGDTVRRIDRQETLGVVVPGSTTLDPVRFVSVIWSDNKKPTINYSADLERA